MKILVSKEYLKWKKANKNPRAADAVDSFMLRVHKAAESAQISPKPKLVGSNLRKTTGTVNEYTLNKQFRVYARNVKLATGEIAFYLATVGVKGITAQNDDIVIALTLFDGMDVSEWTEWQPSEEQLAEIAEISADDDESTDDEPAAPTKSVSKKKGKPLDENGMTVAERKAAQKKQKQEEQRKRNAEKKKAKEATEKEMAQQAQQTAAQASAPAAPINEPVVTNDAPTPIAPVTPDNKPEKAPEDNDIRDDEIRVIEPEPTIVHLEFKAYADAQYQLEMIEHQMKIEQLQIKMIQHEIALEELAKKRLLLLQLQKMKSKEK